MKIPPSDRDEGSSDAKHQALSSPMPPLFARTSSPLAPVGSSGGVAMSRAETVLLSARGDVLVCRCRDSSRAYTIPSNATFRWNESNQPLTPRSWWDTGCDGLLPDTAIPCGTEGLLGGNPPKGETTSFSQNIDDSPASPKPTETEDTSSDTVPTSPKSPKNDEETNGISNQQPSRDNLIPLPSFDYSHFAEGGNDMIPASMEPPPAAPKKDPPSFLAAILEGTESEVGAGGVDTTTDGAITITGAPVGTQVNVVDDSLPSPDDLYETQESDTNVSIDLPLVMHGVPTFLSSISQIRVRHVSAHPQGSHVLMISSEALLFSFGLNDHGQLGNGRLSSVTDSHKGFFTTPTVVTPLLESGGKAVACAAGVDNSFVVVKTEGRRVDRLQQSAGISRQRRKGEESLEITRVTSSPPRINDDHDHSPPIKGTEEESEQMFHHQLYGFGRNNYFKLGLVNPTGKENRVKAEDSEDENVLLPRRVALHCSEWPGTTGEPCAGIFSVAASEKHSAALVRRATGSIELYTWGNADDGALGPHEVADVVSLADNLRKKGRKSRGKPKADEPKSHSNSPNSVSQVNGEDSKHSHRTARNVATPTIVRKLSYSTSSSGRNLFKDGQVKTGRLQNKQSYVEYPVQVALGRKSTFVVTSRGRCLSFGTSTDGLLGRGPGIYIDPEPKAISFKPSETGTETAIVSLSIGAHHAVALSSDGQAYSWGDSSFGRLGAVAAPADNIEMAEIQAHDTESSEESSERLIRWIPEPVKLPNITRTDTKTRHQRAFSDPGLEESMAACSIDEDLGMSSSKESMGERNAGPVVQACAGYDSSVFVTESGRVFSCGKKSGRLGIGEAQQDVWTPKPMYGGLQLWRHPTHR